MPSRFLPVAVVGAFALVTSVFATAQASVIGPIGANLAPAGDVIQIKSGGGGGGRSSGARSGSSRMGSGPKGSFKSSSKGSFKGGSKGSMKGGPKGGPKVVKGGSKGGHVRWSRDRRHRYYGAFFGVPFGYALYAGNSCYDWRVGPRGWGYYWNYYRCPL